jgi:hypothetical protein
MALVSIDPRQLCIYRPRRAGYEGLQPQRSSESFDMSASLRRLHVTALAACVALTATEAFAATPDYVWARPNTSAVETYSDHADCLKQAKIEPHMTRQMPQAPIGGAAGALVMVLTTQKKVDTSFRNGNGFRCMRLRGYHTVTLTKDEQTAFGAQPDGERTMAWIDALYARPDFPQRLREVTPIPLLAPVAQGPAWRSIRIDPAALTVSHATLARGAVILGGPAAHRATATIDADLVVSMADGKGWIPAGAVLHQMVLRRRDGSEHTYWCGPYKVQIGTSRACVSDGDDGYLVERAFGANWLSTGLQPSLASTTARDYGDHIQPTTAADTLVRLKPSDSDLLGPMALTLTARKITARSVTVEARISQGADGFKLWERELTFAPDGTAHLALWTHRLTLTRVGETINATYDATGDGAGWDD